jgi:PIN domain nuclease of toxin-antitoxin system
MRLLLDTNVLIPLADGRLDALPSVIRQALTAPDSEIHASVASLWEIAIKHRPGKLPLSVSPPMLPELIVGAGIDLLAIEAAHVLATLDPEPPTRDPFDRLLLAQCAIENLHLLTTDGAPTSHPLAWQHA